ncbi:ATP-binding protein [Pedobacter sp. AW31-3R]|uniref:PAS domain-containing sensor histidine kinase n=1 Tax=Pedobacter sp. AW31-3R TaxID=3445781 RepID=UPI003F9F6FAD
MSPDSKKTNHSDLEKDFEDFLEHSLSGYISTNPRGEIISVNARVIEWLGYTKEELTGKRITGLLAMGSRMFYETHLSPLLQLKGFFEEVSAELLLKDGTKLQVLLNGYVRNDAQMKPQFIRLNVYRATERKIYEENLRHAITDAEETIRAEREQTILREQFIAVLGHDLRNPLGAIKSGTSLLMRSAVSDREQSILGMMKKSSLRMEELIANVMDFARVRLGGGISLNLQEVLIEPVIQQVIDELKIIFPERVVTLAINVKNPINCDADRLSQLLSNLVANAFTHGLVHEPVKIMAKIDLDNFELVVSNGGKPIAEDALKTLFEPFTREASTPSEQGLGLGLYIASQIASAHQGSLTATSDVRETSFIFRMPLL